MIRKYFQEAGLDGPRYFQDKEYLLTSEKGAYTASAISGCNTRKYHGLLVMPQPQIDSSYHVLLSSIDETIYDGKETYHLSTHQYRDVYYPEGYKLIREFSVSPIPQWRYQMNDMVLLKEVLLDDRENRLFIRYTLEEATGEITLNLLPLLAFRNMHTLGKANSTVNETLEFITNGVKIKPYDAYDSLYIQLNREAGFTKSPAWYYNLKYEWEQNRGYDFYEDLYAPGHFNLSLSKGEAVILAVETKENWPEMFDGVFTKLLTGRSQPDTVGECLARAARQFIVKTSEGTIIKAGYYWFDSWSRDTCISLPGLTLLTGDPGSFKEIVDTLVSQLKEGLLPNTGSAAGGAYNSVDAPLWLVWALQQYAYSVDAAKEVWLEYGKHLISILYYYRKGTSYHIKMDDEGLIDAGTDGMSLTWMDAIVNKEPVTPRTGKAVEVNALWYNAVCFCLEAARLAADEAFVKEWEHSPSKIRDAFIIHFWDQDKKYLADYINGTYTDWSVRPNQLFAVSLPFSPLPDELKKHVVDIVKEELLTPRGLRTLSPRDYQYRGHYSGDQSSRDLAYHQGTVWPWLLGHFAEAYLKVYKSGALFLLEELYEGFEAVMEELCLCTVAEIYDGDFPHTPAGAVSQAWSVAELIRMKYLINEHRKSIQIPLYTK